MTENSMLGIISLKNYLGKPGATEDEVRVALILGVVAASARDGSLPRLTDLLALFAESQIKHITRELSE